MGRHTRARRFAFRSPAGPPVPAAPEEIEAPTDLADLVTAMEAMPSQPTEVLLDYPDGTRLPVDCQYDGPSAGRHRWIAVVPSTARLANGMVIRVDRDTVLAVAVRDSYGALG